MQLRAGTAIITASLNGAFVTKDMNPSVPEQPDEIARAARESYDAGAAILVGLLLIYVAYALGRDIRGLLLGEAARPDQRETLRRTIEAHDEVEDLLELLTMYVGPSSLLVTARVDLARGIDSDRIEQLSNEIDDELREAVPDVTQVFLDATPGSATRSGSPRRREAPSPPAAPGSRRPRSKSTRSGR